MVENTFSTFLDIISKSKVLGIMTKLAYAECLYFLCSIWVQIHSIIKRHVRMAILLVGDFQVVDKKEARLSVFGN